MVETYTRNKEGLTVSNLKDLVKSVKKHWQVENLEAAMSILRRLSGTPAPTKSAAPGPQGPGQFIVEED